MDSSGKASLLLRDDGLQSVRRRNKTLIIIFFSLTIVLALIVGGLITSLVHKFNSRPMSPDLSPAVLAFCAASDSRIYCIDSLYSIKIQVNTKPSQILFLSLQTSIKQLRGIILAASNEPRPEPSFSNCFTSSAHAVGQLNKTLEAMRVESDPGTWTYNQRKDMNGWIGAAAEDLARCVRELWQIRSKGVDVVLEVADLVRYSKEFLAHYGGVNETVRWEPAESDGSSSTLFNWIFVEDMLTVSLFGSQYFVLVLLFCLLLRIY